MQSYAKHIGTTQEHLNIPHETRYDRLPSTLIVFLAFLSICIVYVSAAWTPSHASLALSWLGFSDTGLIAGSADPARGDDFMVSTPLIRNVVGNRFAQTDAVSPYKESFRSFVASPTRDWSLAFKPQFWGFLVLPPANALSFCFFFFYASFAIGYLLLLRRLGVPAGIALIVSLTLLSSQLPQVWWTQRAALYAFAPWPMLAFLSRRPWYIRLPALTCATATWLLGDFYPPAIIGNGFAWAILILAFAREETARRVWGTRLLPAMLALGLGIGLVWLYFSDLIPAVAGTIYPGHRISGGGEVPWVMLLAHLLPNVATLGYRPLIGPSNVCEVGVVGTFLPLIVVIFADHRSLLAWLRGNKASTAFWLAGLGLMLAWMAFPIPAEYGMPFLWHRSRSGAMLWGFGLLLTIGLAILATQVEFRFTARRAAIFAAIIAAAWVTSKTLLLSPGSEAAIAVNGPALKALRSRCYDLHVLVPLAFLAALHAVRPRWVKARLRPALLLCSLLALAATFGRFNPLQSAEAIMTRQTTPILEAAKELAAANPHGWAAVHGQHGVILNAFGVPSIGLTLFRPEFAFFRKLYPDMPDDEFNRIFNRYSNLLLSYRPRPWLPRPDIIALPIFDVGTVLPVAIADGLPPSEDRRGNVDRVEESIEGSRHRLVLFGWAPFAGIAPPQALSVHASSGRILSARAVRETRIDIGAALKNPAYDNAGYALELVVEAAESPFPLRSIDLVATNENGVSFRQPMPETAIRASDANW